jgi:hypothetical protein
MRTVSLALALAVLPTLAHADEDSIPTDATFEAASSGMFAPFGDSPAGNASTVRLIGIHNTARERSSVALVPVAQLTPWLQLQGSLTYEDETLERAFAAQLALRDEDDDGFDLRIGGGWDSAGVNEVDAAFVTASAGRAFIGTYVSTRARFDIGTATTDERGLQLGLTTARPLAMNLFVGLDSQLELDLERNAEEPMDESSWRLTTGPHVSYAVASYVITGSIGLAADKPRMESRDVGMFGAVGVGAAF